MGKCDPTRGRGVNLLCSRNEVWTHVVAVQKCIKHVSTSAFHLKRVHRKWIKWCECNDNSNSTARPKENNNKARGARTHTLDEWALSTARAERKRQRQRQKGTACEFLTAKKEKKKIKLSSQLAYPPRRLSTLWWIRRRITESETHSRIKAKRKNAKRNAHQTFFHSMQHKCVHAYFAPAKQLFALSSPFLYTLGNKNI